MEAALCCPSLASPEWCSARHKPSQQHGAAQQHQSAHWRSSPWPDVQPNRTHISSCSGWDGGTDTLLTPEQNQPYVSGSSNSSRSSHQTAAAPRAASGLCLFPVKPVGNLCSKNEKAWSIHTPYVIYVHIDHVQRKNNCIFSRKQLKGVWKQRLFTS